jgi:HlyD family secretion protein
MSDSIDTSGAVDVNLIANLTWKTSGTVGIINVKVGQKVKAGETLASLESGSLPANIITAQSDLVSAQIALDDLMNSSIPGAEAQVKLADAKDALDTAQTRRESKQYQRASQNTIDEAYANYIVAQNNAKEWEKRYDNVDHLSEDDPMRASAFAEWAAAKTLADRAKANWFYVQGLPGEMEIEIADGNLALAQAQYDAALHEWERLKDGPDENDIKSAQTRIDAAQATINSQFINAPFDGEVLTIETIAGSQVNTGTVAIVIADRSTMKVDALVDELDIFRVQLGNPVEIKLDALPDVVMNGSVSAINPVGNTVNGLVKYTVTISFDNTNTTLYFGSTANVTIAVSESQEHLAVPLNTIKNDSQGEYVLRQLPDGSPERVNIQSYEMFDNLVIVTGDLQSGDPLQLSIPDEGINAGPGGMFGR